jgi:hypothetical protein
MADLTDHAVTLLLALGGPIIAVTGYWLTSKFRR